MYQIFIGSLILSTIHALIPNHWLPLIAIGKTEKWTQNQTLLATIITGFAHTLSTIMIGIVVGLIGYRLSTYYSVISETIAPAILIGLGMVYLFLDFRSHHNHIHEVNTLETEPGQNKSRWAAILTSLSIAMFLTPCIEIEAYYFQAGTIGWIGNTHCFGCIPDDNSGDYVASRLSGHERSQYIQVKLFGTSRERHNRDCIDFAWSVGSFCEILKELGPTCYFWSINYYCISYVLIFPSRTPTEHLFILKG